MENLEGKSGASFSETDKVALMLKRESRFFMGSESSEIQSLTGVLEDLDRFLEVAEPKSVQEAMRKSVECWLEETTKAVEVKGQVDEDCLSKLSRLLREPRIVKFLTRASQQLGALKMSRCVASEHENEKHDQKPFYTFIEEYVDSAAKELMACLADRGPTRSVVSLVGPEGIGKTTLARKVYESEGVRDHFDCCAWIDVSGSYSVKELLKNLLKQIARAGKDDAEGVLDGTRMVEIIDALRRFLLSKRYMFVFDDFCQEEYWHVMKHAFPDNGKGSRIIITTRSDAVAYSCKEGSFDHAHEIKPLLEEMAWRLFCGIAFRDEPERLCPPELVPLAREIIKMCQFFPLPIVATAALLSTKDNKMAEWKIVHENFKHEVKNNLQPLDVFEVLTLSFHDLPKHKHLWSCFLYFSIFPSDSLIPHEKLFMLWISEGFVEEKEGKTLEDVAQEYLDELVCRNLVQACPGFYGSEQFCRVHRLIHSVARTKARERNFCRIWDGDKSSLERQTHRLSICNKVFLALETIDSLVHSVCLFNIGSLHGSFMITLIKKCTFLTLLDFEYAPIEHLPEELGNLSHLKYLCLKSTKVKGLPMSVHKLQNLKTLDLRNTPITYLPTGINKFNNLRHLLASVFDNRIGGDSTQGVYIMKEIGCLENLHTLMTVEAYQSDVGLVAELAKLKWLRRLGISGLSSDVSSALFARIHEISHLESLCLQSLNNSVMLDVQHISSPLPPLRRLILKGLLQKMPDWIFHLRNLSTLCLSLSRLTDDPLIHLSHLPNLVSLWLCRAYEGDQLHFQEGDFRRLKLLVLRELRGLRSVEIEEGALPVLEELRIGPSPILNQVPNGIEHLRNLKILVNYDMPRNFVLSLKPDGGSDYWKVEHIPDVLFQYRVEGRSYISYKLGDSELLDHLQGFATNRSVVTQHQHELESSFCNSDDEEGSGVGQLSSRDEEEDGIGRLSFSSTQSIVPPKSSKKWSFSSGFYTDDVEE